jgi:hemerythrin
MNSQFLEWKTKYELGVEEIDSQHRLFFEVIIRLVEALNDKHDLNYLMSLITELNAFARFHFMSEENMMVLVGFPGYEKHKNHHVELLGLLANKKMEFNNSMSDEQLMSIIYFIR